MPRTGSVTPVTRRLVTRVHDFFAKGDLEKVGGLLAEDYDWAVVAPRQHFRHAIAARGARNAVTLFNDFRSLYDIIEIVPQQILADGRDASVLTQVALRDRVSGRAATFIVSVVHRVGADGRLIQTREYLDSTAMNRHLAGLS